MCNDPIIKKMQPEAKKYFDNKAFNLIGQIELDEKAIEMTTSEFRAIKNDLRNVKDKAIQMNAKLLEKQKAQFESEKKVRFELLDGAVKDKEKAQQEANEMENERKAQQEKADRA